MHLSAQELNKKTHDKVHDKEILINICDRKGLTSFPEFKEMYDPLYASYEPDSKILTQSKTRFNDKTVKIVFGSWCSDSKVNVPHFFKILDALNVDEKKIILIAVDGNKKAEGDIIDSLNITLVPTFIIYDKKGVELGRITEGPKTTLEGDLLEILNKQN